jgi:prepilin-type N-terminal cleavage/methylation domain-containing protein
MTNDSKKSFLFRRNSRSKHSKGFTLIELLVTLSIIAILMVIGFLTYTNANIKARDARRKDDFRSMSLALEAYFQKNGSYPTDGWVSSSSGTAWISGLTPTFIHQLPDDPKPNGTQPWAGQYRYAYCANTGCHGCPTSGQYFILIGLLENTQDPDRNELKHTQWCDGADTSSWWPANVYAISSRDFQ